MRVGNEYDKILVIGNHCHIRGLGHRGELYFELCLPEVEDLAAFLLVGLPLAVGFWSETLDLASPSPSATGGPSALLTMLGARDVLIFTSSSEMAAAHAPPRPPAPRCPPRWPP